MHDAAEININGPFVDNNSIWNIARGALQEGKWQRSQMNKMKECTYVGHLLVKIIFHSETPGGVHNVFSYFSHHNNNVR